MNFRSKLVQNVLEPSVFTCIESLPLVGRSMVLQTVSSFVWIPGHTSLHSAAREGGTMPGEHVYFVSPGTHWSSLCHPYYCFKEAWLYV